MSDSESNLEQLHERVLVMRAQVGDPSAFHELVAIYQERLAYYIQRFTHNWHESSDILQQVWLDAFQKLRKLRAPEAFRVWLYRLAHDRVVTFLRRQKIDWDVKDTIAGDTQEAQGSELELLENVELVHAALEKLTVVHREVMTLRFLEEMEVADIASVMQCSEGTAKSRLHYAKLAMRRAIEELAGGRHE
ncbi:MAG TPA: sigma-70 family RNA polymerase sigma factor [Lacipirellulaceae bacterium]|nr:sigma-70 family RNA polymerase sigma factor [Lacipirellulaceae bacterium]